MQYFTVKYYIGPYSGKRKVYAEDEDEAIAKVRSQIRREMTLSMYSDSYSIYDIEEEARDTYQDSIETQE